MPIVMYALVLHRGGLPVHQDNGPLLAALDLDPDRGEVTKLQLERHLKGELRRQGVREEWWAEHELWVFPVDRDGSPERSARFRFALIDETEEGR